ncbi:transcriptional regulator [Verrucomicrobia bacterium LW23]|nr:transcriptional regulator [Verrucomicrobia bacterium LW23]
MGDPLSTTFAALADPTRRAILARLSNGESNVTELARPFLETMSLPAVTKHLKVLENAGLIQKTKSAQWRTCSLRVDPLREATDWMEQYRQIWESLDRLDDYLKELQEAVQRDKEEPRDLPKPKGKRHARKAK